MTDKDFFWLVGLIEGEGCFTRTKNRPRKDGTQLIMPRIAIVMTDKPVVERVARLMGVSARPTRVSSLPNAAPTYGVFLVGSSAEEWCLRLKPHMGDRRQERIERLLRECEESRRQK